MTVAALPIPSQPADSPFESEEYKKARTFLHGVRDEGKPKEWSAWMRWKMASAHCFYLDFLERVYAFAEYAVEHDDLADYLAWTDCALAQIWEHHHFEENELFPHWEKYASEEYKTHLMHNVEQHHAFARALDACWLYVRRCRALLPTNPDGSTNEKYNSMKPTPVPEPPATVVTVDPLEFGLDPSKPFDPQALRREMGKWVMPAVQHMAEEIGTLTPEYFESMGEKKYLEGEKILAVHLQASDPAWFLIQALCSAPMPALKPLMELPYPVRRLLVPFVWAGKYWGYWKYSSYPENLTFRGTA